MCEALIHTEFARPKQQTVKKRFFRVFGNEISTRYKNDEPKHRFNIRWDQEHGHNSHYQSEARQQNNQFPVQNGLPFSDVGRIVQEIARTVVAMMSRASKQHRVMPNTFAISD
jgi:hypothetical protein